MNVNFLMLFVNLSILILFLQSKNSFASDESPQTFSLSGTLYQTGTTNPLHESNTKIVIQILNPDKTCLLYEEEQTVNLNSTGYFNIQVGSKKNSSKRTVNDPQNTMTIVFQNIGLIFANNLAGSNCIGGLYLPNPGDTRYIRITITPPSTNVPDRLSPDIALNSTPSALVAQSVQGLERNRILQVKESDSIALNQTNLEWLLSTSNYPKLQTLMSGTLITSPNNGVSLPSISNNPSSPTEGAIWYDSVNKVIKFSNGTAPVTLGSGGSGISSLTVGSNLTAGGVAGGTLSAAGTIDLKTSGVTPGTYAKVTVNDRGLVTGSTTLAEADIPTLSTAGKVSASAINTGTMGGNASINTTGAITTTNTVTSNNISTNAIYSPAINGGSTASANLTLDSTSHATKGNVLINPTNGNVGIGTASPGAKLDVKGAIRLSGSTSGYTGFQPAAAAGSTVWTLPAADGSGGQVLTTDGSGILSWSTPAGGGGGITSLNGETGATQTFATPGTTGTAPNWSSATNAHTLNIPMASTATVTAGLISKTDYDNFNTKLSPTLTSAQIFVGNASNVATGVAMSGDASITNAGAVTVNKVKGVAVSSTAPSASGQVLRYDGTSTYVPAFLSLADIRSTVTPTNTMFPASTCTAAQTMTWSSLTDTMTCSNIAISNTAVSGLGTAATLNVGTGINNIVQLDGSSKLPAVDGSALTNISVSASNITTGTLAVANGGTGTTNGSITGTGALTFAAGGTNQNVTLTPSGTGYTLLNGNVGIGTTTPGSALDVKGAIRLSGATSGYTGFQPAAAAGSTVWTLPAADGTNGQVLSTNGSGVLSWTTATTGALTSLNGQTGGTQTFATPGTTGTAPNWSSATNAHTLNIPMASTATVTAGLISKTDYDAFNSKLTSTLTSAQIFVGNGSNVATGVAMSGDAAIDNTGAVSVNKIKGKTVSSSAPSASGQVLRYDGTSTYVPAFLSLADIRSTVTPTNTMFPASTCTAAQTMTWSSLTDTMTCSNIAISNTAVSGLGTAATLNVGTGINNIVQLDGSSKLPAVDGSALTNINVSASNITTGTLAVANGGTGTTNGSITGTGALTFAAGGTNQNVTLTPSGTGYTVLNGNVGVGAATPATTLDVNGNLKIGDAGVACAAGTAGAQRYNSTTKTMQFCNGTSWSSFGNTLIGSLKMTSASSCYWSSSSTSWTLYNTATVACNTATVTGTASSPGKYPAINFSSLTPGTYEIVIDTYMGPTDNSGGSWGSATAACAYNITDGSTSGPTMTLDSISGQDTAKSIRAIFTYSIAQGSTTFTLQAKRMGGTGACVVAADTNSGANTYRNGDVFITVKRVGD